MTALHDLAATELLARYRERSLSPVEVTRAVLERIAAWEPHLHATYALDADAALAAARVSEARWLRHLSAGENVGALEGVPAMLK
jgi:Asp-tRNA(Asn)/Glu-tRNA(Gln) amidotransferase A subunit family amidase